MGTSFSLNELVMLQASDDISLAARLASLTVPGANTMLNEMDGESTGGPEWEHRGLLFSPATVHMYANACMDEAAEAEWALPQGEEKKRVASASTSAKRPGAPPPHSEQKRSSRAVSAQSLSLVVA